MALSTSSATRWGVLVRAGRNRNAPDQKLLAVAGTASVLHMSSRGQQLAATLPTVMIAVLLVLLVRAGMVVVMWLAAAAARRGSSCR